MVGRGWWMVGRGHSCSSLYPLPTIHYPLPLSYNLQIIDHLVHAENEPGVELRHVFLALTPHRALQSHDAIARRDEDLNVVHERIFVHNDLDGVSYFVVVVI